MTIKKVFNFLGWKMTSNRIFWLILCILIIVAEWYHSKNLSDLLSPYTAPSNYTIGFLLGYFIFSDKD